MDFYEKEENIERYSKFIPVQDGEELVSVLRSHLDKDSTVLELGIGPGKDFERLAENFKVTGSDNSRAFLDRYRQKNPQAELIQLDARTLETDKTFDCIYSNKVLIHLNHAELRQSLRRQKELLHTGGLVLHSFWHGDKEDVYNDLRITYYTERHLLDLMQDHFEILELRKHAKMTDNDSIYVLARSSRVGPL
jgi:cyclopropane fatty-acyl-phospholipid synthase-like methyltransferase